MEKLLDTLTLELSAQEAETMAMALALLKELEAVYGLSNGPGKRLLDMLCSEIESQKGVA